MNKPHVIEVDASTFQKEVLDRSQTTPVVVDFWAAWCAPCRTLGPTLERLAEEGGGSWILAKVDVDENPGIAGQYGVQGIPAVKAFLGGKVIDEFTGALPVDRVRAWLSRVVPSEADRLVAEALASRHNGDLWTAEFKLRAAVEKEPDHGWALTELADLVLQRGDPAEAKLLVDRIPEYVNGEVGRRRDAILLKLGGDGLDADVLAAQVAADPADLEARWSLARALAARGDFENALSNLLSIVRRDRAYRDDGARKEMIRIFDVVGTRSPMADRWRDQLAKVLY